MWELDYKESWVPKNWCFWTVVLEKTLESPLDCKEIQPVNPKGNQSWMIHWKDWGWSWNWNSSTLATWCQELTHWKRPWCWERLKAGGEGDDRGWDGWRASLTQSTWVWVGSGSWWWTGKPGMLQSTGSQSDLTEQLNWTELIFIVFLLCASLVVQSVKNLPAGDLGLIPESRRSPWRKKWQPTPVFLPGAFNGQRSLQSLGSPSQTPLSD